MQNTTTHWKTEISDLRARAAAVTATSVEPTISARMAARVLSGVVGHVARQESTDVMQRACAALARHDLTWSTKFRVLPATTDPAVDQAVHLIAVVARGMLELGGVEAVRSAVAFWASEDDPSVWQSVAQAA